MDWLGSSVSGTMDGCMHAQRHACPPAGYERAMCPGFPECGSLPWDATKKWESQHCGSVPRSGEALYLSCLEAPTADGGHVCYFEQPGGYAPFSFTCFTGDCVYENATTGPPLPDAASAGSILGGGGTGTVRWPAPTLA